VAPVVPLDLKDLLASVELLDRPVNKEQLVILDLLEPQVPPVLSVPRETLD